MNSDLTEQYLGKVYDDFSREQQRLMNDLKSSCCDNGLGDNSKEIELQRQVALLNTLMINILKFRNLKKKILLKCNK